MAEVITNGIVTCSCSACSCDSSCRFNGPSFMGRISNQMANEDD